MYHGRQGVQEMQLLRAGARSLLGLCLTAEHVAAFQTYYEELAAWNQRLNLTAIEGARDVQIKHFLDSLTCLLALPPTAEKSFATLPDTVPISPAWHPLRCIDVGTGAGFPGLPLKIIRSELQLTLLDATAKKTAFLRHLVGILGLQGVETVTARAEELGRDPRYRERYDIALARAVARLSTLVEYCLPFCKVGGYFVAQKGADVSVELEEAEAALTLLGGELQEVKEIHIPEIDQLRTLVRILKVRSTPEEYPRRTGIPAKRPLK